MSFRARAGAIAAIDIPTPARVSNYPDPFADRMGKREKKKLGEHFGLKNFGVNLTRLGPGGESALMHAHSRQDELVYILDGEPTLVTESGQTRLSPGMCVGFPARGEAHHLVNRTDKDVVYLEIGDRTPGDEVRYPNDDIQATLAEGGTWQFSRKDGTPY
ncbi:MAG: cupin domain-containing protein [Gammaproteobacteria bacterium]|nr:cupin domain-containing protein [Gammaproteobacteria bacterium]MDE0227034.1 cupin domain-containing protein [Gammaproteobacteria bacterium]MDE0452177.1 cupin domain-containing protein [Gammaproteobacteria bacterium]